MGSDIDDRTVELILKNLIKCRKITSANYTHSIGSITSALGASIECLPNDNYEDLKRRLDYICDFLDKDLRYRFTQQKLTEILYIVNTLIADLEGN